MSDVEGVGESVAKPTVAPFDSEVDCSVTTKAVLGGSDCCGGSDCRGGSDCCGGLVAELSKEGATVAALEG